MAPLPEVFLVAARGLSTRGSLADIGARPHLAGGACGRPCNWMRQLLTMKSRSLLTQVLIVNLVLIIGTVLLAAVAVDPNLHGAFKGREEVVLGLALVATMLGNWLVLRRRFKPLDEVISAMESIDLVAPNNRPAVSRRTDSSEVRRLGVAFDRMISRLE